MNDIHMALETTLKGKLGAVDFTHLNDMSTIDDNMMLIITCIAATRIAADASYAMQDIKSNMFYCDCLSHQFKSDIFIVKFMQKKTHLI
jgi:hypothetical protein